MSNHFTIIHAYTRREAINDGVLVDLTMEANMIGFKVPVAVTAQVVSDCLLDLDEPCPDVGLVRTLALLSCLSDVVQRGNIDESPATFHIGVKFRADEKPRRVELKAVCGPDDNGKPCLTVMLPDED